MELSNLQDVLLFIAQEQSGGCLLNCQLQFQLREGIGVVGWGSADIRCCLFSSQSAWT